MQTRHVSYTLLVPAILTCLFAISVGTARADITQSVFNGGTHYYYGSPDIYVMQNLGAGFSGDVTEIAAVVHQLNVAGANFEASIACFTDDFYLTSCGQSATSTATLYHGAGSYQWATTTLATAYTLSPGQTYQLRIHLRGVNAGDFVYAFGTNLAVWFGGAALPGSASTSGTVQALAFNLSGDGFFGPTEGVSFGDLNATTTSDYSLFQDTASSTLAVIAARCAGSNIFAESLCSAAVFLFVPSAEVMNGFTSIPADAATRFPFSWIAGAKTEFDSLTVSSTTAMTALAYNFADLGIGSTSPMGNILPNVTVFSKDTIETYISPSLWATFQTLIAAGMWLGFFFFEFNRARGMAKTH